MSYYFLATSTSAPVIASPLWSLQHIQTGQLSNVVVLMVIAFVAGVVGAVRPEQLTMCLADGGGLTRWPQLETDVHLRFHLLHCAPFWSHGALRVKITKKRKYKQFVSTWEDCYSNVTFLFIPIRSSR